MSKFKAPAPFSPGCSSTSYKFFHDFDMLPPEGRRMLEELPYCPNFEDLKAAIELAHEAKEMDGYATFAMEEEAKAKKVAQKKMEREIARLEKMRQRQAKWNQRGRTRIVAQVRPCQEDPKHLRLIKRVTEVEAARLLTEREENKDVVEHKRKYEVVRIIKKTFEPAMENPPPEYFEKEKPQHVARQWHNAGGKKRELLSPLVGPMKSNT